MGMRRMVPGVIFFLVVMLVLIIFFAVFHFPLEYTVDSLNDAYEDISTSQGWTDQATVKGGLTMVVWCFVGAIAVGILLLFVYLFALAHKEEYEVDWI